MYENFQKQFKKDQPNKNSLEKNSLSIEFADIDGLSELFNLFEGASFNSGLYRILKIDEISI
ncbi:hypothetical protein ACO0K3_15230 [Undibacterium sp. Rencai35W]